MDKKTVELFVGTVDSVISSMCGLHVVLKEQCEKQRTTPLGDVTGVIDMSTQDQPGTMALSFSKPLALALSERVLMHSPAEIDEEVENLVGELTNMVCGGAKHPLHEAGIDVGFASPRVIKGRRKRLPRLASMIPTVLVLETPAGELFVELSLSYRVAA